MTHETEDDNRNEGVVERKKIVDQLIAQSKLYTIFTNDARGRELLKMWRETARYRVPPGSSLDVYARAEAIRSFIDIIEQQIELAAKERT